MLCRKKANEKKWAPSRNECGRKWKIKQNHMHDYERSEVTATAITYTLRTRVIRNSLQAEHPDDYMMHIKFEHIFGPAAHSRTEQSAARDSIWSLLWLEIIITRKKANEVGERWMFASSKHELSLYIVLALHISCHLKFTCPEYKLSATNTRTRPRTFAFRKMFSFLRQQQVIQRQV